MRSYTITHKITGSILFDGPETSLSGADLSGADLSWTTLSGANLSGANLSGANLSGATFAPGWVIHKKEQE